METKKSKDAAGPIHSDTLVIAENVKHDLDELKWWLKRIKQLPKEATKEKFYMMSRSNFLLNEVNNRIRENLNRFTKQQVIFLESILDLRKVDLKENLKILKIQMDEARGNSGKNNGNGYTMRRR